MRIFPIGDIHGHANELQALLLKLEEEANFNLDVDHLVLLGDLVDAGPDSKKVVEWCIKTKKAYPDTFHPLKGNHDAMFVDAMKYNCKDYMPGVWYYQGGQQTINSYGLKTHTYKSSYSGETKTQQVNIPKEHLDFLDDLPLYWWPEDSGYFFAHAGIPPVPLSELDPDDEKTQESLIWIREEFIDSQIDFGAKVIFAHTSKKEYVSPGVSKYVPIVQKNKIGINTMPRDISGYLTALELPSEKMYFQEKL